MASLAQRFIALVDRSGPHHRWLGATDQNGVPQMRVDGRLTTARRVAWELQHGPLSPAVRVRACPAEAGCVRADHLMMAERNQPRPAMARSRRPRGTGSLRQIRPGVWKLTVTAATNGRVSRTADGDRELAEIELARLAARHGHPPATLDALVHLYLAHLAEIGRSTETVRRYKQLWRTWLAPQFGTTAPDRLQTNDVENALFAMARAGQSRRSIHQAAVVLNSTYAWARKQRIAAGNPVAFCELPDGTSLTGARQRK